MTGSAKVYERKAFRAGAAAGAVAVFYLVLVLGCASTSGRIERDAEVTKAFKDYRVLPDHRYYYAGPAGRPDAIIGVRKAYILQSSIWTSVDLTSEQLKKWVRWMDDEYGASTRRYPYGFRVVGPDGQDIGVWYSIYDWTTVLLQDGYRVQIFPPQAKGSMGRDRSPLDRGKKMD